MIGLQRRQAFAVLQIGPWLLAMTSVGLAHASEQRALDFASVVVGALRAPNFPALSQMICPGFRLGVSPYSRNLPSLHVTRFSPAQVAKFGDSQDQRTWGRYDGTGEPIVLTPRQYFASFVYDRDYAQLAQRRFLSAQAVAHEAELRALSKAYRAADVVVYRYPGTADIGFKDARELLLVLGYSQVAVCLRAIAHSEDTV